MKFTGPDIFDPSSSFSSPLFVHSPFTLVHLPPPLPHTHTHTQAQNANDSGDYDSAKNLGRFSLGWNIGVYIFYALATIAWIIAVAVVVSQAAPFVRFG